MTETGSAQAPPASRWALLGIACALLGLRIVGFVLFGLLIASIALMIIWVGIPLLLGCLALLRAFARVHRRLAGRVLGAEVADPPASSDRLGLFDALRYRLGDRNTWRELAWLLEVQSIGFALQLAALIAFPFLPLGWWGSPLLLRTDATTTRMLIGPQDGRLQERIGELESSRARTVDHSAAELRRIERDLHDGAQAQLVALGMNLGLAQELVDKDPAAATALIAEARVSSSTALAELRSLVRGIHPPVLADRGLTGGIAALALAHPRPVEVDADIDGRPPGTGRIRCLLRGGRGTDELREVRRGAELLGVDATRRDGADRDGGRRRGRRRGVEPGGWFDRHRTETGRLRRNPVAGEPAGRADNRHDEGAVHAEGGRGGLTRSLENARGCRRTAPADAGRGTECEWFWPRISRCSGTA